MKCGLCDKDFSFFHVKRVHNLSFKEYKAKLKKPENWSPYGKIIADSNRSRKIKYVTPNKFFVGNFENKYRRITEKDFKELHDEQFEKQYGKYKAGGLKLLVDFYGKEKVLRLIQLIQQGFNTKPLLLKHFNIAVLNLLLSELNQFNVIYYEHHKKKGVPSKIVVNEVALLELFSLYVKMKIIRHYRELKELVNKESRVIDEKIKRKTGIITKFSKKINSSEEQEVWLNQLKRMSFLLGEHERLLEQKNDLLFPERYQTSVMTKKERELDSEESLAKISDSTHKIKKVLMFIFASIGDFNVKGLTFADFFDAVAVAFGFGFKVTNKDIRKAYGYGVEAAQCLAYKEFAGACVTLLIHFEGEIKHEDLVAEIVNLMQTFFKLSGYRHFTIFIGGDDKTT